MKIKQLNKLTMQLAVEGICDGTPTAWQPVAAFANAYADLKTRVANIQTFAQSQVQDNTGIAQDKKAARQAMCATALPVARAVHAYAVKSGNNTLAQSVDFTLADLVEGRDVHSLDVCQNIYNTANTNLANLAAYGITGPKLAGLTATIATYSLLISKPRDTRAIGKTVTTNLQAEFDAADVSLGIMDDLLGQIANPTFVSNYKNARIIVDTAASHASHAGPTPPVPIVPPIPPVTPTPTPVSPKPVPSPTTDS